MNKLTNILYYKKLNDSSQFAIYHSDSNSMQDNHNRMNNNLNNRMITFKTEQSCFSQKQRLSINSNTRSNKSQKPEFATLDQEFQYYYNSITKHEYFSQLNKHAKIRINKWLTKLSNISVNQVWKKNRNNYIKLIKLMFDLQIIIAPINSMPPERDLHKLTNPEMNIIIDQVQKLFHQKNSSSRFEVGSDGNQKHSLTCVNQSSYVDHHKNYYESNKTHVKSSQYSMARSKSKQHLKSAEKSLLKIPKYPSAVKQIYLKNKQNIEIIDQNSKICSSERQKTKQCSQIKKSAVSSQYFSSKARTFTVQSKENKQQSQQFNSESNSKESNSQILQTLIKGMTFMSKFSQISEQQDFRELKELFIKNSINIQIQNSQKQNNQINKIKEEFPTNAQLQEIPNSKLANIINIVQNYSGKNQNMGSEQSTEQKFKKKQKLTLVVRANKSQTSSIQENITVVNKIIV